MIWLFAPLQLKLQFLVPSYLIKSFQKMYFLILKLKFLFTNPNLFTSLKSYETDCNNPLSAHVTLLINLIISLTYMKLKINMSLIVHNETSSLRTVKYIYFLIQWTIKLN